MQQFYLIKIKIYSSGTTRKSHISYTNFCYIKPFCFHAHLCHIFPYYGILNRFDRFVSFIHVASGEMKTEIHDRFNDYIINFVNPRKILQNFFMDLLKYFHKKNTIVIFRFKYFKILRRIIFLTSINKINFWSNQTF